MALLVNQLIFLAKICLLFCINSEIWKKKICSECIQQSLKASETASEMCKNKMSEHYMVIINVVIFLAVF